MKVRPAFFLIILLYPSIKDGIHGILRRWLPVVLLIVLAAGCPSTAKIDTSGMSFSSEPLVGKMIWHDLVTEDIASAKLFYGKLFGWTFEDTVHPGGRPYSLARIGDIFVAGLVPIALRPDGKRLSRWLPYVSVGDVDAAVSKATASGADVVVGARDVNFGRVAAIIDPEGAVIGLAQSRIGDPDDRTTMAGAGRVVWTELLADNPLSAVAFYRAVVGYSARTIERRGGRYTLLEMGGIVRAGIFANPSDRAKPRWLTYFGVDDPSTAAARVKDLGGSVILPVSPELREGTMAVVTDPSGAVLVLQKVSNK